MFFTKAEASQPNLLSSIVLIGTSAQSFYLADILQSSGHKVTFLIPSYLLEKYQKIGSFCIKPSRFQNKHASFQFTSNLTKPADFCFICSHPGAAKNDILLLNHSLKQPLPIINLSSFYNSKHLDNLPDFNIINAFFNAQITMNKTTIELLERSPKIELFTNDPAAQSIKNLFSTSNIDINICNQSRSIFWQHLATYFISSLLFMVYDDGISPLLNRTDIRKQTDLALTELIKLAKKENISLDSGEILASIYTISDNYRGDIQDYTDFNAFSYLIKGINHFDTPVLSQLMSIAAKKY